MVVGTVIDPEMANQIRVTVVATGLGRPAARCGRCGAASRAVPFARSGLASRLRARGRPTMRVVRRGPMATSDYATLDKPTVQRQRAVGDGLRSEAESEDLLDIPAFLRRQAD